jgi:CxxC motif-containing protein
MNKEELICIVCPLGCHLIVEEDSNSPTGYKISGNQCKRGEQYAIKEKTNPTRILTSTVKVKNAHLNRLPVKTDGPVPKDKIFECMKEINKVEVTAPVKVGQIIINNILGTGVNVIATRDM